MNTLTGFWSDLNSALDFLLRISERAPLGVWAVLVGFIVSWALTGWLNHYIPKPETPNPETATKAELALFRRKGERRELLVQFIASVIGFAATYFPYPTKNGVLLGILVGVTSPYAWTGLCVIARPVWAWWKAKWPSAGS